MNLLSLAVGLLSFMLYVSAVDTSSVLSSESDEFINNILAEWNTAGGAAVAVVRMGAEGGWPVETKGYGVAKADGTKVTPNTIFALGSDSKQLFDVLATGLLISNETLSPQISWTIKLASVIPEWKLTDPVASAESTIIDLMSHRTELPCHDFSYFISNDCIPALIQRLKYLKPSAGFRETFQYNNIIHILDPFGMNSTTYSFAVANATGRMTDEFSREGMNASKNPLDAGATRVPPFFIENRGEDGNNAAFSGPGGVLSTAVDAVSY
ncbi:beta-lactamase/transpeptidase-like protein [Mycena vulgaris]|nr:beta-lactamase/transpeptidase-like protein [Mycena vulgaris]